MEGFADGLRSGMAAAKAGKEAQRRRDAEYAESWSGRPGDAPATSPGERERSAFSDAWDEITGGLASAVDRVKQGNIDDPSSDAYKFHSAEGAANWAAGSDAKLERK